MPDKTIGRPDSLIRRQLQRRGERTVQVFRPRYYTALPYHLLYTVQAFSDGTHDGKISVEVSRGLPLPSLGT